MLSDNIWYFVSYKMFSQDTLLYSAAEPAQSFSGMQRKYSFVVLAEELWRGTRKRQRGFSTWGGRLRDCGKAGMMSPSFHPSCTCGSSLHTFLPWWPRAASIVLGIDVPLSFASWDAWSQRRRRGGGEGEPEEKWKSLWMQQVPLQANWGRGWALNGKSPSPQTQRIPLGRTPSIPPAILAWYSSLQLHQAKESARRGGHFHEATGKNSLLRAGCWLPNCILCRLKHQCLLFRSPRHLQKTGYMETFCSLRKYKRMIAFILELTFSVCALLKNTFYDYFAIL